MSPDYAEQEWRIDPTLFYKQSSEKNKLEFLLKYAVLAPSAHNAQPWLCKINKNVVEIYYDLESALKISDPTNREGYLSLGAFAYNLYSAGKAFNLDPILNWKIENNLVAEISFSFKEESKKNPDLSLLKSLTERRVNRTAYSDQNISKDIFEKILELNTEKDLEIGFITEKEDKRKAASLITIGMEFAFHNSQFRKELSRYIISNNIKSPVGIPGYTANLSFLKSLITPFLIKNFQVGKSEGIKDYNLFSTSPAIIVISSESDTKNDWLRSGFLFESISIFLTSENIAFSVSGTPIEAPASYTVLQKILKSVHKPQMFFRIGYSKFKVPHSPRKSASDIIIT